MKKILFAMMVMMVTMCSVSFANGKVLDRLDAPVTIICGDGNVATIKVDEHFSSLKADADIATNWWGLGGKCAQCGAKEKDHPSVHISNLRYAYKVGEINITNEVFDECAKKSNKELEKAIKAKSEQVEINGEEWYVNSSLLANGMRLLFTNEGGLSLISFNMGEIDLYAQDFTGNSIDGNRAEKVRIGAIFTDGYCVGDNVSITAVDLYSGAEITNAFFVCTNHRKCLECNRAVAVSDMEIDISAYCEEHTCAFVWETNNEVAGIGSTEGLMCKEKNDGSTPYCSEHRCMNCTNPVIGVNLNDIVDEFLPYDGDNGSLYSRFCAKHACRFRECRSNIANPDANTPETSDGIVANIHKCCERHSTVCIFCGLANLVTTNSYNQAGHRMVCPDCLSANFINGQLKEGVLKTCANCGQQSIKGHYDGDTFLCTVCALDKASEYINGGLALSEADAAIIAEEQRKLQEFINRVYRDGQEADWRSAFDFSQISDPKVRLVYSLMFDRLENNYDLIKKYYVNSQTVPDDSTDYGSIYGLTTALFTDPEIYNNVLSDLFKDMGIDYENSELLQSLAEIQLANFVCPKCGGMRVKDSASRVYYCPNYKCGENIVDDYSSGSSGGSGGGGGGGGGGSGSGSSTGVWNSWSQTGTANATTCVHANYDMLNVTFTNVTANGHTQNWTCANCKTQQTSNFSHVFVSQKDETTGKIVEKCVCGYASGSGTGSGTASSTPKVVEVYPSANATLQGGENVKIKIENESELAEVVYTYTWGNGQAVTKNVSGTSIELDVGSLPKNQGTYELYIQSIKDANGNEFKVGEVYVFAVGNGGVYVTGSYTDNSMNNEENNSVSYEDDSYSATPV